MKPSPVKKGKKRRASVLSVEENPDDDRIASGAEDNEAGPSSKKKATGKAPANDVGTGPTEYRYNAEIAQMVYVFGEIQNPTIETVNLIEDMVRSQMIELATRARMISHLRSGRFLNIEDVIYLIRDDRARVNRLRTYLSWKEVRKTARKEESSATKGGADVDVEDLEDDLVEKRPPRKEVIKLPWEPLTPFAEVLKNLPNRQNGNGPDEEEDDDELEAYEDSVQRLREADSVTRRMSKEQYVFYSECRQASFTYRKAKRFRDFLNTAAYLDVKPNEDVMDVLGFLAFESVRSLCVAALQIRDAAAGVRRKEDVAPDPERSDSIGRQGDSSGRQAEPSNEDEMDVDEQDEPKRIKDEQNGSDLAKDDTDKTEKPSSPPGQESESKQHDSQDTSTRKDKETDVKSIEKAAPSEPWKAPPTLPLLPAHLYTAYSRSQKSQVARKGGGLRNWRGGINRSKITLI